MLREWKENDVCCTKQVFLVGTASRSFFCFEKDKLKVVLERSGNDEVTEEDREKEEEEEGRDCLRAAVNGIRMKLAYPRDD